MLDDRIVQSVANLHSRRFVVLGRNLQKTLRCKRLIIRAISFDQPIGVENDQIAFIQFDRIA